MSDADDLEAIRERRLERLRTEHAEGESDPGMDRDGDDNPGDARATEPSTPDAPIHVEGPDHFESLLADHRTVLVDFYADWCGPCQMLAPVLEDLAARVDGAAIATVDTDAQEDLAAAHGVRSLPTLLLFVDGEPVEQLVGAQDGDRLERLLERYV